MSALRFVIVLLFTLGAGAAAQARILVEYDAAPLAGGFTITNQATCAEGGMQLVIDLAGSEGELTFTPGATLARATDRPHRVATGAAPSMKVADQALTLTLDSFAPGERIIIRARLASDYDEAEIALYDRPEALIAGAEAAARTPGSPPHVALFGADGRAEVETDACRF